MKYVETVLAGIFPNNIENYTWARNRLSPEHFKDDVYLNFLWRLTCAIVDKHLVLPAPQVVKDSISKSMEPAAGLITLQKFVEACKTKVSISEFKYAVDSLLDEETNQKTGEALAIAFQIFDTGYEVGGKTYKGHEAVREYLLTEISIIDKTYAYAEMDEGSIASSVDELFQKYQQSKAAGTKDFIPSNIKVIDDAIGGASPGDLGLITAYTSMGKSMASVHWSYQAMLQGKNVYYATTETTRQQILNRLVARHSRDPKFGLPKGLDHKKIRLGTLSGEEEKAFYHVLKDFKDNKDYGKVFISQLAGRTTVSMLEQQMMKEQREWNIDLVAIDYLNLLKPSTKRSSSIEEGNDKLTEAKTLATSFNGHGVAIISPWQINREGYEHALVSQEYQINHLAQTSEAEKTADWIVSMFQDQDRKNEVYFKMLKTRDSSFGPKEKVMVDYRNAYFGTSAAGVVNLGFSGSDNMGISA